MVWLQYEIRDIRFEGSDLYEYDPVIYGDICTEFDRLCDHTKKLVFLSAGFRGDCMYGISLYGLDFAVFEPVSKGIY